VNEYSAFAFEKPRVTLLLGMSSTRKKMSTPSRAMWSASHVFHAWPLKRSRQASANGLVVGPSSSDSS
jgi:hypothetical protein